jgi:hypothetical protein
MLATNILGNAKFATRMASMFRTIYIPYFAAWVAEHKQGSLRLTSSPLSLATILNINPLINFI